MACFLVPTTEAIVTTIVKKTVGDKAVKVNSEKHPFLSKLNWLNNMLWGGSALLAFEHVWHGEVTPFFPFLTAMQDAGEMTEMFHEMATSGVAMAAVVTLAWVGIVVASNVIKKRNAQNSEKTTAQTV